MQYVAACVYSVKVKASRKVGAIAADVGREAERELVCCSHSVLFVGPFGRRDPHEAFIDCRILHADGVVWRQQRSPE